MDKKVYKRYSEAFKREVVREYEAGVSARRLREKYGIQGGRTVTHKTQNFIWVQIHSLTNLFVAFLINPPHKNLFRDPDSTAGC